MPLKLGLRISQIFMTFNNSSFVGDTSGFSNDSETTISGIVSIIKKP
jgi:hypothetical protein